MDVLVWVKDLVCFDNHGKPVHSPLDFSCGAGEWIYLQGTRRRCEILFDVLSGLRSPEAGILRMNGHSPYEMPEKELARFRRDNIGDIFPELGWMPELPLLDQMILPLLLKGMSWAESVAHLKQYLPEQLPLHSLHNRPGKCTRRKQQLASLVRAAIKQPSIWVIYDFPEEDDYADELWKVLTTIVAGTAAVLYLGTGLPPEQVQWAQKLTI